MLATYTSILAFLNQAKAVSIALAVTISDQVMHGLGKHTSRLDADERDSLLKVCEIN